MSLQRILYPNTHPLPYVESRSIRVAYIYVPNGAGAQHMEIIL